MKLILAAILGAFAGAAALLTLARYLSNSAPTPDPPPQPPPGGLRDWHCYALDENNMWQPLGNAPPFPFPQHAITPPPPLTFSLEDILEEWRTE